MKPNLQRIRLLIDALKSGEFRQAQGNLRRDNSYCCLGVACEVFRQKTGEGWWKNISPYAQVHDFVIGSTARSGYLPGPVAEWFGLDSSNPMLLNPTNHPVSATFLNDINNKSFHEIGEAFERTYFNDKTA